MRAGVRNLPFVFAEDKHDVDVLRAPADRAVCLPGQRRQSGREEGEACGRE